MSVRCIRTLFVLTGVLLMAACKTPGQRGAAGEIGPDDSSTAVDTHTKLFECTWPQTVYSEAEVTPEKGATIQVANQTLRIEPGAVGEPVQVVLIRDASRYLKVEAYRKNGNDMRVEFRAPATLTLSWRGCPSSPGDPQIVQVDPATDEIVREFKPLQMRVNEREQTVSAELDHLSGYAIGNPN